MFLGNKEITGIYLGDKEITGVFLGDKEIWTSTAEDLVVFSATTSIPSAPCYGFAQSNRVIDSEWLSDVMSPITNYFLSNGSATKTATAYTPTEKALEKYKYAKIKVKSCIGGYQATATGAVCGKNLPTGNGSQQTSETTIKVELTGAKGVTSYAKHSTSYANMVAYSNIAIMEIILTNSEE